MNIAVGFDDPNIDHIDDGKETFRIGDLASEFNVTLRTLRFYEDRGLIQPKRNGSTRIYSRDDRARLKLILTFKGVGFSLVDIECLLSVYDRDEQDSEVLDRLNKKCAAQMDTLQNQKSEIEKSISDLHSILQNFEDYRKPRN